MPCSRCTKEFNLGRHCGRCGSDLCRDCLCDCKEPELLVLQQHVPVPNEGSPSPPPLTFRTWSIFDGGCHRRVVDAADVERLLAERDETAMSASATMENLLRIEHGELLAERDRLREELSYSEQMVGVLTKELDKKPDSLTAALVASEQKVEQMQVRLQRLIDGAKERDAEIDRLRAALGRANNALRILFYGNAGAMEVLKDPEGRQAAAEWAAMREFVEAWDRWQLSLRPCEWGRDIYEQHLKETRRKLDEVRGRREEKS